MGKGRFLLNMAKTYPNINFIGIERYSSVLLRAVEKFDTEEFSDLPNIRFVCMDARELPEVFAESEVDRIYLNFSDPWPKSRHAKRRLTSLPCCFPAAERRDLLLAENAVLLHSP